MQRARSPHKSLPLFRAGPFEGSGQKEIESDCIECDIHQQLKDKWSVASWRTMEPACDEGGGGGMVRNKMQ